MRLVKIAGMDLRRFEFDCDLTWFVFFLNADETIYGRYGGRDASGAEGRLSLKGLRHAMGRALDSHTAPPAAQPLAGKPQRAEDYSAAKRHQGCIHCHNVNEFRRADLKALGTWDRRSVWVYPLPENVGLSLEVDVGDRVKSVGPNSAAAKAGLKPGDRLTNLNGHSIASFADAQYALHQAPWTGEIGIAWTRGSKEHASRLALADGWKKTNLTWRPSMLDILPAVPFNGEELTAAEKRVLGLEAARAAIRQEREVDKGLLAAGVRGGDILIGYDGLAIEGDAGTLFGHLRRNYLVGENVTVNLIRDGKRVNIKLTLK